MIILRFLQFSTVIGQFAYCLSFIAYVFLYAMTLSWGTLETQTYMRPFLQIEEFLCLPFELRAARVFRDYLRTFLKPRKTFTRSLDDERWRRRQLKVASPKVSWYFFSTHTRAACSCEMALAEGTRMHARTHACAPLHALARLRLPHAAVTPACRGDFFYRIGSMHARFRRRYCYRRCISRVVLVRNQTGRP